MGSFLNTSILYIIDAVEYGGSGKECPVLVVGRSREDIRVFGVDRGGISGSDMGNSWKDWVCYKAIME